MDHINKETSYAPCAWQGEVILFIGGEPYSMRLTLGALARCEAALGLPLSQIVHRLEEGTLSVGAATTILMLALEEGLKTRLQGGGSPQEVPPLCEGMIDGGVLEVFRLVQKLFERAFYGAEKDPL